MPEPKSKEQLEYQELQWKVQQLELTVADMRRPSYKKISFWTSLITVCLAVIGVIGQSYISSYKNAKAEFEAEKYEAARDSAKHKKDSIDRMFALVKDSVKSTQTKLDSMTANFIEYSYKVKVLHNGSTPQSVPRDVVNSYLDKNYKTLLNNSQVNVYYINDTESKAANIADLLNKNNAKAKALDHPYSIGNINQIVYYNKAQLAYCKAVQALLSNAGLGNFSIRPSSGRDSTVSFFKIYVVKN